MTYQTMLSEAAEQEAEQAFLWLSRRTPEFAGRWYDGLLQAVASLSSLPNRCPLAREDKDYSDVEVRQLLYRKGSTVYRILFCIVDGNTVRVLHIRHGAAQDFNAKITDDNE